MFKLCQSRQREVRGGSGETNSYRNESSILNLRSIFSLEILLMAWEYHGRRLSFDILSGSSSLEEDESLLRRSYSDTTSNYSTDESEMQASPDKPKRRKKKHKKKKISEFVTITEDPVIDERCNVDSISDLDDSRVNRVSFSNGLMVKLDASSYRSFSVGTVVTRVEESEYRMSQVIEQEYQKLPLGEGYNCSELRQRTVLNGSGVDAELMVEEDEKEGKGKEERVIELSSTVKQCSEPNGNIGTKLETADSLDWKQFMAEDPNYLFSVEKSPLKYFMDEMYSGNSLRSTTTLGNEKERERVYDTIFRLPWRCELLIDVGLFVCLDSFLSLLTLIPARVLLTFWRFLSTRQFKRPSAAALSDFGCFIVLACGVTLLEQTDISLIYHMIRGQGTVKLYVVYNVLEIFDKLCQNFGGDVLQTLFSSSEGLSNCSQENMPFWIWRFISDQVVAVAASIVHSFVLLVQAITLSTCIVAHNNALLALLVSNNFAEIKSNVFKRFSKDNIQNIVYSDSVERFHISAFVLFVLAQNILEAEGPWFEAFISNALLVYISEMAIDIIKHSFIAKFNDIKPITYSEFLEDLCKQTLNITEHEKKNLTFVPLAPACVVIRVLTPVYAAHLPYGPLRWRFFWIILLFAMTYVMLASLKVLIGIGLRKHASWYVKRCQNRKLHTD